MNIQLVLYKSLIVEAVKAETYIKGTIDRAVDEKNVGVAYHETAGDEEVHERKILRCIETSLAELKGEVSNFLDATVASSATNIFSTEEDDKILITIKVSDRFNQSLADPLAKIFSKYIEDRSLVLWWGTINQQQAQFYMSLVSSDLTEIKNLFTKTAPLAVEIPYPSILTITGSEITLTVGDEEDITYSIDEEAVDDIEMISSNKCVRVERYFGGEKCFKVKAMFPGVSHCILYSRHDETHVYKNIDVIVTSERV